MSVDDITQVITTVGLVIGTLITVLGGIAGAGVAAYRSKIKPELDALRRANEISSHELQPNSGKSLKDRSEKTLAGVESVARDVKALTISVDRLAQDHAQLRAETGAAFNDVRAQIREDRGVAVKARADIYGRLTAIESPNYRGEQG